MRMRTVWMPVLPIFLMGGFLYGLIELIWRGYTHWSMVLTGGLVCLLLCLIRRRMRAKSLPIRCLLGSLSITTLEFIVGCGVNLGLGMQVWDYSDRPFHLLGQICPLYSFYWFLLCIPAFSMIRMFDPLT